MPSVRGHQGVGIQMLANVFNTFAIDASWATPCCCLVLSVPVRLLLLIGKTIHPHPTLGEFIGMAAEVAHGSCTDVPPARK